MMRFCFLLLALLGVVCSARTRNETNFISSLEYQVRGTKETVDSIAESFYGYSFFNIMIRKQNFGVLVDEKRFLRQGLKLTLLNPYFCVLYMPASCLDYLLDPEFSAKGLTFTFGKESQLALPPSETSGNTDNRMLSLFGFFQAVWDQADLLDSVGNVWAMYENLKYYEAAIEAVFTPKPFLPVITLHIENESDLKFWNPSVDSYFSDLSANPPLLMERNSYKIEYFSHSPKAISVEQTYAYGVDRNKPKFFTVNMELPAVKTQINNNTMILQVDEYYTFKVDSGSSYQYTSGKYTFRFFISDGDLATARLWITQEEEEP